MRNIILFCCLAVGGHAMADLKLVGDARPIDRGVRLTRAKNDVGGAMWRKGKGRLAAGFDTEFRFQISKPGGLGKGADGFAFVIQNHGNQALGGYGGAGGFASGDGIHSGGDPAIPFSLAVFFDTFRNEESDDPSGNFLSVAVNGHPGDARWPPKRLTMVERLPFRLKDGKPHHVRIQFDPPVLSVYLDGNRRPILSTVADLSPVLDAQGSAYVGFTASTGGGWANHDILDWDWRPNVSSTITVVSSSITFAPGDCLEGRNLCTPERVTVSELESGRYRLILPAHIAADASIPNPRHLPVAIINASGIVCSDMRPGVTPSCSGPDGRIGMTTAGGRTTFTIVNLPAHPAPNQGFFEFHAELETEMKSAPQ